MYVERNIYDYYIFDLDEKLKSVVKIFENNVQFDIINIIKYR